MATSMSCFELSHSISDRACEGQTGWAMANRTESVQSKNPWSLTEAVPKLGVADESLILSQTGEI
jgi:hypothetical protein